jgi:hypothetical protein
MRLVVMLPRFAVLAIVFLLATATLTFAASKQLAAPAPAAPAAAPEPVVLTVPDVQRQAYVFAKGILEDHGFAWRVEGAVQGFAANSVASQQPAPGTQVVDTGAPLVVLRLAQNASYAQDGTPENASPYAATAVKLVDASAKPAAPKRQAPKKQVASKKQAAPKKAVPKKRAAPKKAASKKRTAPKVRKPAFTVDGAPKEPTDEMPLPDRARMLARWIAAHPTPTASNAHYYRYQHAWIVTGATFGWSRGAEALRILIRADARMEAAWDASSRNRSLARAALAHVEARSR